MNYDPQDWPDASEIEIKQEREIASLKFEVASITADRDEWKSNAEELANVCENYERLVRDYKRLLAETEASIDSLIARMTGKLQ